jgi:hypothetical protein
MNNSVHISGNIKQFFWVKILKFLYSDLGTGMEKIRIRDPGGNPTISRPLLAKVAKVPVAVAHRSKTPIFFYL